MPTKDELTEQLSVANARIAELEESAESDTVAMLRADLQRVTIERDDARNQRDLAQKRLNDAGTLHGSIDSLPSQV